MIYGLIQILECFLSCTTPMHKNLYIILLFPFALHGQDYFKDHFGGTVGLTVNFGTHINAVGINLKGYYTDYFAQLNGTTTFYFFANKTYNTILNFRYFFKSNHPITYDSDTSI